MVSSTNQLKRVRDVLDGREWIVNHETSLQEVRIGLTVGGKCMYFACQTRKGDLCCEYLTKHEVGELIGWLQKKHKQMEAMNK